MELVKLNFRDTSSKAAMDEKTFRDNFCVAAFQMPRRRVQVEIFNLAQSVNLSALSPVINTGPDGTSTPFKPETMIVTLPPETGLRETVGVNRTVMVLLCAGQALPPV